jgi:hypothetical protein
MMARPLKLFAVLLLGAGAAQAADSDVAQCRTIKNDASRLACYDAMTLGAAPAAPTRKALEQSFGLAEKRVGLDAIESTIPGKFEGWSPNEQITLANGQVWKVIDDSTGVVYGSDLKVTIERSAFGSTMMVIQGTTKAPKVKRIR